MENIKDMYSPLTEVIRSTSVDGIMLPLLVIRDMVPHAIPTGRVTLLGDATHPMAPFRGEGGNDAMLDGLSVTKAIRNKAASTWPEMLKDYEREMIPRGTSAVMKSREAAASKDATGAQTHEG